MTDRYLDRKFDQDGFDLDVANFMANERVRRTGYRRAYDAATKTLSDAEFDAKVEREENGDPFPW